MMVDPEDGTCRECHGSLQIVDFDDSCLTIECLSCGTVYDVETDAFNDGCLKYHFTLMLKRIMEGMPDD